MEQRLGLSLFQRLRGRLHPTLHAQQLFAETESLSQNVERINRLAQTLASANDQRLRVTCSPSLAYGLMPIAVSQFSTRHPDVRVTMEGKPVGELTQSLLTQEYDVGLAMVPVQHPRIQVHTLFRNRILVVLPKQHRLASRRQLTISDLKDERLVGYGVETPLSHAIARLCDGAQVTPRWVAEVKQTYVACALVQHGMGLALVDEQIRLSEAWPELVFRELTPSIDLQISLCYGREAPLSAAARDFVDFMLAFTLPTGQSEQIETCPRLPTKARKAHAPRH